ncbi:hypothetical protein N7520_003698 [Penicillium odoratum]|uniref:uncharacterized protein n=1 Tax=Penicillium odoratum TaxID=1167516 RepID=UPI0025476B65|nr:uncharacterized protein N7520_003698 [Penicillium odoratum]KAJ5769139.1 hypothetical protein N7520_003698 [Penicillium odoratum]
MENLCKAQSHDCVAAEGDYFSRGVDQKGGKLGAMSSTRAGPEIPPLTQFHALHPERRCSNSFT